MAKETSLPKTISEKLDWIENHGSPTYLDKPSREVARGDGTKLIFYPPPDRKSTRREVQSVYQQAFQESSSLERRRKVVKSYVSNFPHLAFDPDSWFWPLWWEWRARYDRRDKALLRAVASGVTARGAGWMDKKRFKAYRLEAAKRALERLRDDPELHELYVQWNESARLRDPRMKREYDRRFLSPLITCIHDRIGYRPSPGEIKDKKLSGILLRAVSKALKIRERNLH